MRIGIDFDNTIACYSSVFADVGRDLKLLPPHFSGDKEVVKSLLLNADQGEQSWMTIQGQVYGAYIDHATVFDGLEAFLKRCRSEGAELFIISHKTQFGHFDPQRVDLRRAAQAWLNNRGICAGADAPVRVENVYFLETREEKVQKIQALQCTHFIDDLAEVLTHENFPTMTKRFLFAPNNKHSDIPGVQTCASWNDLEGCIFVH